VQHLDNVTGQSEDVIHKIDSTHSGLPAVSVFVYRNWPVPGFITGFTFGLSTAKHPDWKLGRPELMISMESLDEAWPLAIGYMAESLRGKCPFCYGNTINFNARISEESNLDAFLLFFFFFLTREQMAVSLGGFTCNITGMYPMYRSEVALYEKLGLKQFWDLPEWDPLNPHRKPMK